MTRQARRNLRRTIAHEMRRDFGCTCAFQILEMPAALAHANHATAGHLIAHTVDCPVGRQALAVMADGGLLGYYTTPTECER